MVVKIGSSTVVGADGKVNRAFIGGLADQAAALRKLGWRLVVVSSGAIACGYPVLGFDRKPVGDLPSLQACASAGQCIISSAYDEEFHARDLLSSLVLLTRHDTARRASYLHARDALLRLVELGVVPVVNENDTVTVDEIKFGDNDTLAALVSCLVSADLCVTLSDIDGLYTANPSVDPTATLIPEVTQVDRSISAVAGDSSSSFGTGGMSSKVRAARGMMAAGIPTVICEGRRPRVLLDVAEGKSVGTRFQPPADATPEAGRKLWIGLAEVVHGTIELDEGAATAVLGRGASILPVGVSRVEGTFEAGEVVNVTNPAGELIGRGVVGYSSDDMLRVRGLKLEVIARFLGEAAAVPAVHRDELLVL